MVYVRTVLIGALLLAVSGCSKRELKEIEIDLPANFSGQVDIEMGVPGAPELHREKSRYVVSVPADGKVVTSTVFAGGTATFGNVDNSRVWGYTPSVARTGDGIVVGGSIQLFVGTQQQYENEEAKKPKSRLHQDILSIQVETS